jgi:hypothetical protein
MLGLRRQAHMEFLPRGEAIDANDSTVIRAPVKFQNFARRLGR